MLNVPCADAPSVRSANEARTFWQGPKRKRVPEGLTRVATMAESLIG
jgi:hypothetical protein